MTADKNKKSSLSSEEKMLRGTAWLTFGNFAGRLLGALYVIPWYHWMGDLAPQANALYGMGYNIYAIFLVLSTTGLNTAVAKQIAKYNAIDQEDKGLGLARQFLSLMGLSGVLFALMMYFGAPLMSRLSGADASLIPVLRSLTLAVLVFPAMSVLRGVFQGYNNIKSNALSQLAEQFIRVIWMLLTTFYIMKMGSKNYLEVVNQSTFAAFVGMLASLAVLGYYLWKEGLVSKFLTAPKLSLTSIEGLELFKETFRAALPIILTGAAIQFYQLVDQASFINLMAFLTDESRERLTVVYAYLTANPNKIIMMIVAVATSIGEVGIPLLTENYVKQDARGVARLIINSFQMLFVFVLPALTGAIILARPLYTLFYEQPEPLALGLFVAILVQTLLQCGYMALSPMLHAVYESRQAVRFFIYGFLVKVLTQVPLIFLFKAYGPIWSTNLGLLLPIVLMLVHLQRKTNFNPKPVLKNTVLIIKNTVLMALPVLLVSLVFRFFLPAQSKGLALIQLLITGGLGGLIYGYLSLKTRSIDGLLGQRASSLRQKLRIN